MSIVSQSSANQEVLFNCKNFFKKADFCWTPVGHGLLNCSQENKITCKQEKSETKSFQNTII